MKKLLLLLTIWVFVGGVFGAYEYFRFSTTTTGNATDEVIFEVPPGASLTKVAVMLEEKGLIASPLRLRLFARLTGQQNSVKRGEYLLNKGMTPQHILD